MRERQAGLTGMMWLAVAQLVGALPHQCSVSSLNIAAE